MTIDNMRMLKFETMIREIDEALTSDDGIFEERDGNNLALRLIFDYPKLNEFGKQIIKITNCKVICEKNYITPWEVRYSKITEENRVAAAKAYILLANEAENRDEALKFIFWSLMMLTVGIGKNKEEKLDLVCDFVRMLKISDNDVKDLINIIGGIYHKKDRIVLASRWVIRVFGEVLKRLNIKYVVSSNILIS